MSKGMWTKHYDSQGRSYFFNAALSKSLWEPPTDGIVHCAPFLSQEIGDENPSENQCKHFNEVVSEQVPSLALDDNIPVTGRE